MGYRLDIFLFVFHMLCLINYVKARSVLMEDTSSIVPTEDTSPIVPTENTSSIANNGKNRSPLPNNLISSEPSSIAIITEPSESEINEKVQSLLNQSSGYLKQVFQNIIHSDLVKNIIHNLSTGTNNDRLTDTTSLPTNETKQPGNIDTSNLLDWTQMDPLDWYQNIDDKQNNNISFPTDNVSDNNIQHASNSSEMSNDWPEDDFSNEDENSHKNKLEINFNGAAHFINVYNIHYTPLEKN